MRVDLVTELQALQVRARTHDGAGLEERREDRVRTVALSSHLCNSVYEQAGQVL